MLRGLVTQVQDHDSQLEKNMALQSRVFRQDKDKGKENITSKDATSKRINFQVSHKLWHN